MFEIKDLQVNTGDKEILKNFSLTIGEGETHILMGPNGAGKSTVCKSILHHPSYQIKKGSISFFNEDITEMPTHEIAKKGIYYINQNPTSLEGVTNAEVLRTALIERESKVDVFAFHKECKEICEKLDIPTSFVTRDVNSGMSGGEKKKNELLGMWILKPKLILLDEIDSGLDVDAIKTVAKNLLEYQEKYHASFLVITHQQNLIELLKPTHVHMMKKGTIVKNGDASLITEILQNGFTTANDMIPGDENE